MPGSTGPILCWPCISSLFLSRPCPHLYPWVPSFYPGGPKGWPQGGKAIPRNTYKVLSQNDFLVKNINLKMLISNLSGRDSEGTEKGQEFWWVWGPESRVVSYLAGSCGSRPEVGSFPCPKSRCPGLPGWTRNSCSSGRKRNLGEEESRRGEM